MAKGDGSDYWGLLLLMVVAIVKIMKTIMAYAHFKGE